MINKELKRPDTAEKESYQKPSLKKQGNLRDITAGTPPSIMGLNENPKK